MIEVTEPVLQSGDLLTIAGATPVALIITHYAKRLFNLTAAATRSTAMLVGLVVVVGATVLTTRTTDPLTLFLSMVVGMQTGLAASQVNDNISEGISHETVPGGAHLDPNVGIAILEADETGFAPEAIGEFE